MRSEQLGLATAQVVGSQELLVRRGGDGEPGRHGHAGADQLAEAGALAADLAVLDAPQSLKPADVRARWSCVEDRDHAAVAVDADPLAVRICLVPNPVPTTAGSPYSRETIAAWDMIPPMSETAP